MTLSARRRTKSEVFYEHQIELLEKMLAENMEEFRIKDKENKSLRNHIKKLGENYMKEKENCCDNCTHWDKWTDIGIHVSYCHELKISIRHDFYCSEHRRK